jgi:hypothetical protein
MSDEIVKIIFLDIDGVMNNELAYTPSYISELERGRDDIDPRCMDLLNILIEKTNAKVVISSVWRIGETVESMQEMFNKHGFKGEIVGLTPTSSALRGNEILRWIKDNEEYLGQYNWDYVKYVIFDDDSDMLYWQRNNFIQIDSYCGLTPHAIYKAEWILNGTNKT